jgi:hypothetical protein
MKKKFIFLSLLASLVVGCSGGGDSLNVTVSAFSEGLVPVTIGSSTGYVNTKNESVIPFSYTRAYHFHKGTAVAVSGSNYFLINKTGVRLTPTNYLALILNEQHDNYFFVTNTGFGLLNLNGEQISSTYPDMIPIITSNRIAFYNGVAWGFLNERGAVTIPSAYQDVYAFSNDLAGVKTNGVWGFIKPDGSYAIPAQYNNIIYGFNEYGHAVVQLGSNQLLINRTGTVIKSGYSIELSDGLYSYRATSTSGYQILKTNGEFLLSSSYYRVWGLYGSRGANVQLTSNITTDKNVIFDENGSVFIEKPYSQSEFMYDMVTEEIYLIDFTSATRIVTALKDNKQRMITAQGILGMSNGWIIVSDSSGRMGAYNPKNEVAIPLLYQMLLPTSDQYFIAMTGNKIGIIDQSGKTIIPFTYDNLFFVKFTISVALG